MQYLLDKNTCIFFLRGMLNFDDIIRQKGLDNCYISELTVFELKYGAENSENPKKSHRAVDKFVKGLTVIPIFGVVKEYAETKVYLRREGTPLHHEFDLIIGVTALANNSSYNRMNQLPKPYSPINPSTQLPKNLSTHQPNAPSIQLPH